MSTNNYKFENILIVIPDFKFDNRCLNEECEHFEEEGIHCEHVSDYYDFDTEGFNMYIKDIQSQLKKIGFDDCGGYEKDSSYLGKIIASIELLDKNDDVYKSMNVVVRSGYYSGENIDYTIEDNSNDKPIAKLDKKFDTIINKVKKILRASGTELLKVAQFSNGEAVYKKK